MWPPRALSEYQAHRGGHVPSGGSRAPASRPCRAAASRPPDSLGVPRSAPSPQSACVPKELPTPPSLPLPEALRAPPPRGHALGSGAALRTSARGRAVRAAAPPCASSLPGPRTPLKRPQSGPGSCVPGCPAPPHAPGKGRVCSEHRFRPDALPSDTARSRGALSMTSGAVPMLLGEKAPGGARARPARLLPVRRWGPTGHRHHLHTVRALPPCPDLPRTTFCVPSRTRHLPGHE